MWQVHRFYIEVIVKISSHLTLRSSVTNLGPPQRGRSEEEKGPGRRRRGTRAQEEKELGRTGRRDQGAGGEEPGRRKKGPGVETMKPEAEEEMGLAVRPTVGPSGMLGQSLVSVVTSFSLASGLVAGSFRACGRKEPPWASVSGPPRGRALSAQWA